MLIRRSLSVPVGVVLAVTATMTGTLSACSSDRGPTAAEVGLAPGTTVFAAPPPTPDCTRIDVTALGSLTTVEVPSPRRVLTYADPSRPQQTWAGCAGVAADAADASAGSQPAAAADAAGSGAAGAAGSGGVLKPTREGSTGPAAWLVRYATSPAAARSRPLANPYPDDADHRTIVRSATLGDTVARVELSVRADTHLTLVLVSVLDPRTGRNSAECGIGDVPGQAADDAVAWCLRAIAGQLVRRPGVLRTT